MWDRCATGRGVGGDAPHDPNARAAWHPRTVPESMRINHKEARSQKHHHFVCTFSIVQACGGQLNVRSSSIDKETGL